MATYSQSNSEFESKESEFESMPAPSISTIDDYAARTKALNEGQPLEPIVQVKTK